MSPTPTRILPALCAATLLALVALGCGGGAGPAADAGPVQAYGVEATRAEIGTELKLYLYPDYIDPALVTKFEAVYGVKVIVDYFDTNEALIAKLQAGGTGLYDVIVPSEYGVTILAKNGLLEKLDHARIPNMKNLLPRFRNPPFDPGNQFTTCFMWGTTGIGYRKDLLPKDAPAIDSWAMVFDPKYEALGAFAMLDDQRETIGAALKYLGYSLNSVKPDELAKAEALLQDQRKRVLNYAASSNGRDLLSSGDVVMVHNFSGDIAMARDENPMIAYAIPKEGSSIWTDSMAIPKGAKNKTGAQLFMNFILDPENGAQLAHFCHYGSPNAHVPALLPKEEREDPATYPPEAVIAKQEFIQDIGDAEKLYAEIWTRLRAGGG